MDLRSITNPKDSNIYRKYNAVGYSTPMGSHSLRKYGFSINVLSLQDIFAQAKNKKSNK